MNLKRFYILLLALPLGFLSTMTGCSEREDIYSGREYVMFSDTVATYPVFQEQKSFSVPVVSTVTREYERTFGVEIIDKTSNAVENRHYRLLSNTVTIPAGELRGNVEVVGLYDNIDPTDSIGFTLRLVMPDELESSLYGRETKVVLMKSCPYEVEIFTGWCMMTSMFLYSYSTDNTFQRLVWTEKHPNKENAIICRDWNSDGYDVVLELDPEDPMSPTVTMKDSQPIGEEMSFFGIIRGDNKIRASESGAYPSFFYSCNDYLLVSYRVHVNDLKGEVGTVGHYYSIMEWVSDEEAIRLRKEEGVPGTPMDKDGKPLSVNL